MHRRSTTRRSRLGTIGLGLATLGALAIACSSPPYGLVTVGVQSEPLSGLVQTVRVTAKTNEGTRTEMVDLAKLPWETNVGGRGELALRVEGLDANAQPVITRTARATIPAWSPDHPPLLRVRLTSSCLAQAGVSCTTANQTCLGGKCVDDRLAPSDLEPYSAGWASDAADACRPANPGTPEVIVGSGQTDYLPLTQGQVVQLERGPQGGHHFWVAVRVKNLHRSGCTTTISGGVPNTQLQVPPAAFVFSFDTDQGGYCKLYGLRFQVDSGNIAYTEFLDKDFDVTVTVKDGAANTTASGTMRVHIAPTIL